MTPYQIEFCALFHKSHTGQFSSMADSLISCFACMLGTCNASLHGQIYNQSLNSYITHAIPYTA